jgi:hypothetical protein
MKIIPMKDLFAKFPISGFSIGFWSERSACAAHAALQMGCMANEVATKFIVFLSFYALLLFSQKGLS